MELLEQLADPAVRRRDVAGLVFNSVNRTSLKALRLLQERTSDEAAIDRARASAVGFARARST